MMVWWEWHKVIKQISQWWYCLAVYWHLDNVVVRNVTFLYLLFLMRNDAGDWERETWQRKTIKIVGTDSETGQRGTRSNSGVRARLTRTCWTISELNPVCHDSTAALTVACSFSAKFRDIGIANSSSGNNLGRLLRSVPRRATCWHRTGAILTCAVLWSVCYACVSYGWGKLTNQSINQSLFYSAVKRWPESLPT